MATAGMKQQQMTPNGISKMAFCRIIKAIVAHEEREDQFASDMEKYLDGSLISTFGTQLVNEVVKSLETCFLHGKADVNEGYISWWLWDSPEAGAKPKWAKIGPAVGRPDGMWYSVATPELLYEFLTTGKTSKLVEPS